jgi:hypothetical protein
LRVVPNWLTGYSTTVSVFDFQSSDISSILITLTKMQKLKPILHFLIIFLLGFNVSWTFYYYIKPVNKSDGFVEGYIRCCFDIERGCVIINKENVDIYFRDSTLKLTIKRK